MKKALFIDVENQQVTQVTLGEHFTEISKKIGNGCELFTCLSFKNGDTLYIDDESLLRPDNIKGGFKYKNWNYPIVSNAIILGSDSEGESIDAKSTTEDALKGLVWLSEESAKNYAKNPPPTFILSF